MFCPKCAAQNVDGAGFCRVCGVNISLIPNALSGELPEAPRDETCSLTGRPRRGRGEPNLEAAFKSVFMGIAFVLVAFALAYTRMGANWWFWMLIPAFSFMGTGIAQYIRYKEHAKRGFHPTAAQPLFEPRPQVNSFPTRATGELVSPPPSVTEGTTRHLGVEAPTRHLEK